ncbi:spore coat associated protein CotJA [Dethiothermospora halolimnae]|uniref:spore coat associated protein CotJA n=1 Tax=Dethiothermospora halolimnae TaxID=3114390 RepID=UPI003CCB7599
MDRNMYPDYENYCDPRKVPKKELAEAYVPFQVMGKVYEPRKALCKGTLFPELYRPYKYEKDYC